MDDEVIVDKGFLKLIERRFGKEVRYPSDCDALSQSIYDATGERIGVTTLKRLFGFVEYRHVPRAATLDVLAKYLGYEDFSQLKESANNDVVISEFSDVEMVESGSLRPGDSVIVRYVPDRMIKFRFTGGTSFIVEESVNSKLHEGDKVDIASFVKGFSLLVNNVERDGENLGSYTGAKQGGLKEITVVRDEEVG